MSTVSINRWFRDKAKYIFIGVCVVIMIVWLVPAKGSRGGHAKKADYGVIFGEKVNPTELYAMQGFIINTQRSIPKEYIPGYAYETILFSREAKRYGIAADQSEIDQLLVSQFPGAGDVDFNAYDKFLSETNLLATDYEKAVEQFLTSMKLFKAVGDNVNTTEQEAWLWYQQEHNKIKAAYVMLKAQDFAPLVKVDDEQLRKFYDSRAQFMPGQLQDGIGYMLPEKVSIEYLLMPWEKFVDQVSVSDEEIAKYYEKNKNRYIVASATPAEGEPQPEKQYKPIEEVKDEITPVLKEEKARELATNEMKLVNEDISAILEANLEEAVVVDFKKLQEKKPLLQHGLNTQLLTSSDLEKEIPGSSALAQKAFGQSASSVNRPRGPVVTNKGPVIFQIKESQPPQPADFESIKADVEKDFRLVNGLRLAFETAVKGQALQDLDAAAEAIKSEVAKLNEEQKPAEPKDPTEIVITGESAFFGKPQQFYSQYFAFDTGLPGNGNYVQFANTAFQLKENQNGLAIEPGENMVFLIRRIAAEPAERATFDAQKDVLMSQFKQEKRRMQMDAWFVDVRRRANPSEAAMQYLGQLPQWSAGL